ncbi:MAG: hypothetical protein JSS69_06095 [Acidobacteria bacterium]|nr:hypothetical protein [Acidobacteriota bacterium]MBS1865473.1 hypothetical protein [Acidobacteriota bacterium]
MTSLIQLSCFCYERMLVFYPRDLREKFGRHMVEVFEDLLRDISASGNALSFVALWRTALWEVVSVGIVARMQDTFVIATATSVLLSSLITWTFFWVLRA